MGLTKSDIFTAEQNEIAAIGKALGHPARVAILQQIIKSDSCICKDLVDEIGLAQPTVSQHLKELKNMGIIQGNIEGTSICYCLNIKVVERLKEIFTSFLKSLGNKPFDCC